MPRYTTANTTYRHHLFNHELIIRLLINTNTILLLSTAEISTEENYAICAVTRKVPVRKVSFRNYVELLLNAAAMARAVRSNTLL